MALRKIKEANAAVKAVGRSRKNYEERSKKKKVVGTAGFEPATTTPPV
jgi:hypothetical protein